jgi:hypothetical protein
MVLGLALSLYSLFFNRQSYNQDEERLKRIRHDRIFKKLSRLSQIEQSAYSMVLTDLFYDKHWLEQNGISPSDPDPIQLKEVVYHQMFENSESEISLRRRANKKSLQTIVS